MIVEKGDKMDEVTVLNNPPDPTMSDSGGGGWFLLIQVVLSIRIRRL